MGKTVVCATLLALVLIVLTIASVAGQAPAVQESRPTGEHDWPVYGGAPENNHYSSLAQINRENVKQLTVAWSFDAGEEGGLQTSPIIVDGVLYGLTPTQKVFALDAATGKQLWKFDSGIHGSQPNRGLTYWSDAKDKSILVGASNFLYALDAVALSCRRRPVRLHGPRSFSVRF